VIDGNVRVVLLRGRSFRQKFINTCSWNSKGARVSDFMHENECLEKFSTHRGVVGYKRSSKKTEKLQFQGLWRQSKNYAKLDCRSGS